MDYRSFSKGSWSSQVLLSKVKLRTEASWKSDLKEAVELLKGHFAEGRLTANAKELAQELQLMGVRQPSQEVSRL